MKYCEPKYFNAQCVRLAEQDPKAVAKEIMVHLKKIGLNPPYVFVTYDKNGGYGNKDHKVIHRATRILKKMQRDIIFYEVTINRDKTKKWLKGAARRLRTSSMPKLNYWIEKFGLPAKEINLSYSLTSNQLYLKRKALQKHASQMTLHEFPLSLSGADFKDVFGVEYLAHDSHHYMI